MKKCDVKAVDTISIKIHSKHATAFVFFFVLSRIFYYDSPNAKTETKYRPMPWKAMVSSIFNVCYVPQRFIWIFLIEKKNPNHRISKINRSIPHRRPTNPRVTSRLVGIVNHDPPSQIQKRKYPWNGSFLENYFADVNRVFFRLDV